MKVKNVFISLIYAMLYCLTGCINSVDSENRNVEKELISIAEKYLVDYEGVRIPVKCICVVWIGPKIGLQPVEPYTCVHYWFPNQNLEATIVVDDKDYQSVIKLKNHIDSLKGQQIKSAAFPNCKISFIPFNLMVDERKNTIYDLPNSHHTVCLIEYCGEKAE